MPPIAVLAVGGLVIVSEQRLRMEGFRVMQGVAAIRLNRKFQKR